ncbi:hypothetical protein [Labedaea rhizosphaerae]|uniref:Uncharacterized protein n=1 Tax=Labedaea rhizosphaerae TaxID=598644 RepID=A0A4V3CZ08_LABRH|nr:hypothetical protein [Labedaea rhizosphaerae]TDP96218.1 hypothetical protein EV186_104200 [Labedaea rhizosphaerae]
MLNITDAKQSSRKQSSTDEYLGQSVLHVSSVPARATYLIASGSRSGFIRAAQEATTRWGGATEPIIEIPEDGTLSPWSLQVVSAADVDCLVNVDALIDQASLVAEKLNLALIPLEYIDNWATPTYWTTHPLSASDRSPGEMNCVIASPNASLWEVAAAGDIIDFDHRDEIQAAGWGRRSRTGAEIGTAQLMLDTALDKTTRQFYEHERDFVGDVPALLWLVKDDDIRDCIYFWNIRALRPLRHDAVPMALCPLSDVTHWTEFGKMLAGALERPEGYSPDLIICSLTASEVDLETVAEYLNLTKSFKKPKIGFRTPPIFRQKPFTYRVGISADKSYIDVRHWFAWRREYGQAAPVDVQLFRNETSLRFKAPASLSEGFNLLRIKGDTFDKYPRRQGVAELILRNSTWRNSSLQINTYASDDYFLKLSIPSLSTAVDVILKESCESHSLSDKGRIGQALSARGSTSGLLQPNIYQVISSLTTPRAQRLRQELAQLQTTGVDIDASAVEKLVNDWGFRGERRYRSNRSIGGLGVASATVALELLCSMSWSERGFEIACATCGVHSFVPLAEVPGSGTPSCPGCGTAQGYQTDKNGVTSTYRLNALVDRASDQGVIPHLVAIEALTNDAATTYLLPGVDVVLEGNRKLECDIFGVRDGLIISGEVKTQAQAFDLDQISRDVEMACALGADIHFMAAMDHIPDESLVIARAQCSEAQIEFAYMHGDELEVVHET